MCQEFRDTLCTLLFWYLSSVGGCLSMLYIVRDALFEYKVSDYGNLLLLDHSRETLGKTMAGDCSTIEIIKNTWIEHAILLTLK